MANPFITEQAILGANPEAQNLERQRKIAELLMAQGLKQPEGTNVSGHYVKPAFTQQLQPLFSALMGTSLANKTDEQTAALSKALRSQKAEALTTFQKLMSNPETRGQAMQYAANNEFLQPMVQEYMKPQKLNKGENFVMPNIGGESINLASGAPEYHAPTSVDMGTLGTMLIYPDGRREMVQKGREGPAGQVLETENGPMLVNTRTGQAQPIMAGGQPVAGGKPLTESQSNATAFGMRAKQSDAILKDLESKGVTNTGIIRSAVGGTLGLTPFVGEKLEQATHSAMNVLPSVLGGPNEKQQEFDAAKRNFITAVLRKESGATIQPSEFYNESQKYFPQVGDSDSVLKQKQEARQLAIKALEFQSGPSGAKQIKSVGTSQDQQALDWANSNPNDPRAVAIKKKLGVQ